MSAKQRIEELLKSGFNPLELEVIDDSASHIGHAGNPGGGESHFKVKIVSKAFAGMSRIETHRAVYAALQDEIDGGIHALNIDAKPPVCG